MRVGTAARQTLRSFIDPAEYDQAFDTDDAITINGRLRKIMPRYLMDDKSSSTCARWIIGEWGGIRTGLEWIDYWLADLAKFSSAEVDFFVSRYGTDRVSSWSKLLAFAKPTDYAIYDAKVATSLNCALRHFSDARLFAIPTSQVNSISEFANQLPTPYRKRGYVDYLAFLREGVRKNPTTDILNLEMILFANYRPLMTLDRRLTQG